MARKKTKGSIVYSTDPDFNFSEEKRSDENFLPVEEQKVLISLDRKQRAGKVVTLIYGFDNSDGEIEKMSKEIKKFCGTGGAAKNGEIIIQGDFRNRVHQWLLKNGYKKSKII